MLKRIDLNLLVRFLFDNNYFRILIVPPFDKSLSNFDEYETLYQNVCSYLSNGGFNFTLLDMPEEPLDSLFDLNPDCIIYTHFSDNLAFDYNRIVKDSYNAIQYSIVLHGNRNSFNNMRNCPLYLFNEDKTDIEFFLPRTYFVSPPGDIERKRQTIKQCLAEYNIIDQDFLEIPISIEEGFIEPEIDIIQKIIIALDNKKLIVFFSYSEPLTVSSFFYIAKYIKYILSNKDNININQFKVLTILSDFDNQLSDYVKTNFDKIGCPVPDILSVCLIKQTGSDLLINKTVRNSNAEYIKDKKYRYICLNKNSRPHRTKLLLDLYKENLLDNYACYSLMYSSYGYPIGSNVTIFEGTDVDIINKLAGTKIKEYGFHGHEGNYAGDVLTEEHNSSYFSVVTESEFYKKIPVHWVEDNFPLYDRIPCIRVTEKVAKPIIHKMPFILVGDQGILEYLRRVGVKTFQPYINEDYDLIEDDNERLTAIVNEIKRLCLMPIEELQTICSSLNDIIEHNYKLIESDIKPLISSNKL